MLGSHQMAARHGVTESSPGTLVRYSEEHNRKGWRSVRPATAEESRRRQMLLSLDADYGMRINAQGYEPKPYDREYRWYEGAINVGCWPDEYGNAYTVQGGTAGIAKDAELEQLRELFGAFWVHVTTTGLLVQKGSLWFRPRSLDAGSRGCSTRPFYLAPQAAALAPAIRAGWANCIGCEYHGWSRTAEAGRLNAAGVPETWIICDHDSHEDKWLGRLTGKPGRPAPDEARVTEAARLAGSGMSRAVIAETLGVGERTVSRWLGRPRGRPEATGDVSRTTAWRRRNAAGAGTDQESTITAAKEPHGR
jgi:hypothetical protein